MHKQQQINSHHAASYHHLRGNKLCISTNLYMLWQKQFVSLDVRACLILINLGRQIINKKKKTQCCCSRNIRLIFSQNNVSRSCLRIVYIGFIFQGTSRLVTTSNVILNFKIQMIQ